MSKTTTFDKTKNESRNVICNNCGRTTNHTVCSSAEQIWEIEEAAVQGNDTYEMIRCLGCDQISFRTLSGNSEDYNIVDDEGRYEYNEKEELYPSRLEGREPLKDQYYLPGKIKDIYNETHSALISKLKILASIGTRALIEAICLQEKTEGRNLERKIDDLVKKDVLTKSNAEILHKTRFLGNRSAHEVVAASDQELEVAFDIIENLLENVYIIPQKAKWLRNSKQF